MQYIEENIAALMPKLMALGLPIGMQRELYMHLCFEPSDFAMKYRQVKNGDQLSCSLYFQKREGALHYDLLYVDVCLRKQIVLDAGNVNGIEISDLEKRMAGINWHFLGAEDGDLQGLIDEETAAQVISDLKALAATEGGDWVANLLCLKYWEETPLSVYCRSAAALKLGLETSQRFYFFKEEAIICLEEAYRFLCLRWREKLWHKNQKKQVHSNVKERSVSPMPGVKPFAYKTKDRQQPDQKKIP